MRVVLQDRVVDLGNGRVEGAASLTQFECQILQYLRAHTPAAVSRDQLLVDVWGYPQPVLTRCVDSAVRRIRQKIEADHAKPRHLLTVKGEGYRWRDGGTAAATEQDRCCGRAPWSQKLAWAESTFGPLDPHDPRVGLAADIRAVFVQETAALNADSRALLDLLCLSQAGWTPGELAQHADTMALRALIQQQWVEVDGMQARLGSLWWPVRSDGSAARRAAMQLWTDRYRRKEEVDFLELLPAFRWPEVSPDECIELLTVARNLCIRDGFYRSLLQACEAVLEHSLLPEQLAVVHLARCPALFFLGFFGESSRAAEHALAAAQGTSLLGEALGRTASLAQTTHDLATAAERFPLAIHHLRHSSPFLSLTFKTDLAIVLWLQGHTREAEKACRAALVAATLAGLEGPQRYAEQSLAFMQLGLGQGARAIGRMRPLYDHYALEGPPDSAAGVARYLCLAHLDLGQVDEGEAWAARSLEHARHAGSRVAAAQADTALAYVAALRGHWLQGNAAQLGAISNLEDMQLDAHTLLPSCWVAVGAHASGNPSLSRSMLQGALRQLGSNTPAQDRAVLSIACGVLGVQGPTLPPSAEHSVLARIAQRAWAGLAHPSVDPVAQRPTE
jgi:hypothetical protein